MTKYGYRTDTKEILAFWESALGANAVFVTKVTDIRLGERLAAALSMLSAEVWEMYCGTPGSTGDPEVPDTQAWRVRKAWKALEDLADTVRNPGREEDSGIRRSSTPANQVADTVGLMLHELGNRKVTEAVAGEVQAEVDGMLRADRGDFTGRARQAVSLTRLEVSPTQVEAAWQIIANAETPWGNELFGVLDPTAACAAVADWLQGAVELAAERIGVSSDEVLEERIFEDIPTRISGTVLDLLAEGMSSSQAVQFLVSDAVAVSRGDLPKDIGALLVAAEMLRQSGGAMPTEGLPRLTHLDPSRPALDMLAELLVGIFGCFVVWAGYASPEAIMEGSEEDFLKTQTEFCNTLRTRMRQP